MDKRDFETWNRNKGISGRILYLTRKFTVW